MTLFYANRNNCRGIVEYKDSVFIVKSGSKIAKDARPEYKNVLVKKSIDDREKMIKDNLYTVDGDFMITTTDFVYASATAACNFIFGITSNGIAELKDENGKCFRDIYPKEKREANAPEDEDHKEEPTIQDDNSKSMIKMQSSIEYMTSMIETLISKPSISEILHNHLLSDEISIYLEHLPESIFSTEKSFKTEKDELHNFIYGAILGRFGMKSISIHKEMRDDVKRYDVIVESETELVDIELKVISGSSKWYELKGQSEEYLQRLIAQYPSKKVHVIGFMFDPKHLAGMEKDGTNNLPNPSKNMIYVRKPSEKIK